MDIRIITETVSRAELTDLASKGFGDMIKAVVDTEQGIMAVGSELHADAEAVLAEQRNSKREHLWGINLYPAQKGDDWIEFNSMINLKPHLGNRSRGVENLEVREKIIAVVAKRVSDG